MRTLIPLLILGALLILAGEWQSRNSGAPRRPAGDPSGAVAKGLAESLSPVVIAKSEGERWDLLVLGRPSGAEPLRRPQSLVPVPSPPDDHQTPVWVSPIPSDTRYVVRPNDALGLICQTHSEVRPLSSVVEAVAAYNDLKSVHAIKSGDVLLLPDPAVLFQDR